MSSPKINNQKVFYYKSIVNVFKETVYRNFHSVTQKYFFDKVKLEVFVGIPLYVYLLRFSELEEIAS